MADVNKSIQINVEADLKHLLNNLQKMPEMTKKEATKMVKSLSTELKKAELAAKNTAKSNQKSFQEISKSADQAAKSTQNFKKQSRELGGAINATGDLLGELDPALGSAVISIQMAGMAVRDLGKAFLTGNPIILGVVAIIAGLTAAYYALTASQREAERKQKLIEEATEKANQKFAEQAAIISNLNKIEAQSTRELLVLTGQMSQLQADIANEKDKAKEAITADLQIQQKYIGEQRRLLQITKRFKEDRHSVSDEEKKILETAMLTSKNRKFNQGILDNEVARQGQLARFQEEINKEITKQVSLSHGIQKFHEDNLQTRIDILEFTAATKEEEKRIADQQQKAAKKAANDAKEAARIAKEKAGLDKEEADQLRIKAQLQSDLERQQKGAISIENQNRSARISLIDDEMDRLQARFELDRDIINQNIQGLEAHKAANLAIAQTEDQLFIAKAANAELDNQILGLKESIQIKEEALAKTKQKNLSKEADETKVTGAEIAGFYIETAKGVSELIKVAGGENKRAAMVAFRVSQAAAIAEIGIITAKKVMEFAGNPIAMAAIGALGAAQIATVAMQKPPEFHMGGVIGKGDDTRQITALTGESILDRRTTQRLGGERGIQALQRGENPTSNQVIVIQPYKHFDRYIRTNQKRGGVMSKLNKVKSAGAY